MDSDGKNVVEKITGDVGNLVAGWSSWSPNGRKIGFHTPRCIEIMNVDDNVRKLLYSNGYEPDWKRPPQLQLIAKAR